VKLIEGISDQMAPHLAFPLDFFSVDIDSH
jgi:hypothetical protein